MKPSWWNRLRKANLNTVAGERRRSARRSARPMLEAVEARLVMSASAAIVGNQLVVTGDSSGNSIQIDHLFQDTVVNGQFFADFKIPGGVVVNSGTGADQVSVLANELPVTINGQNGRDNVIIGKNNTTDANRAEVFVTNEGSFTTLQVVDNLGEFRPNVQMSVNTNINLGIITGLAPGRITYRPRDIANLNVFVPNFAGGTGLKGNTVTVNDTFTSSSQFATTTISEGFGDDTYFVRKTTGPLTINGNAGNDALTVGSAANTLDTIQGTVLFRGGELGKNPLTINDQGSTTPHTYTLFGGELRRSGAASIFFSQVNPFVLNKGPVKGTPPAADGLSLARSVRVGQPLTLTGRLTDADKADKVSLAVDWGDGTAPVLVSPNRKPFRLRHRASQEGPQTVRVIWTDSTGESNFKEATIDVVAASAKASPGKAIWS
jgi:hypothetical protein